MRARRWSRVGAAVAVGVLAAAVTWGGCRQNEQARSPEDRIGEAVAEKLAAWRARRAEACRRAALTDAQLQVDTLIMDYALAKRLELPRPSRPIRPEEPPLLRPDDTLRLEPFRRDTLIRAGELPRRRPPAARAPAADSADRNPRPIAAVAGGDTAVVKGDTAVAPPRDTAATRRATPVDSTGME